MTAHTDDPWICGSNCNTSEQSETFDDNFVSNLPSSNKSESSATANTSTSLPKLYPSFRVVDPISSSSFLSQEDYAKKLEEKLTKLQRQKQPSGKDMLENLKEKKDLYLSELIDGLELDENNMSVSSESFLDRLYNTNAVYRHMNPQQALESCEKEPFAKHDYLNETTDEPREGVNEEKCQ